MNTAKQLISAFVDAPPLYWDRSYVQNMREIRGYPNWWRIRDDVAYIDGPPQEGQQYTKDLFNWKVEIVKDEDTGENTNKLELYNLVNTLEESTTVVNGETVYSYKYREVPPELEYTHTDVIDSVSVEFDQLGRRLIAFESSGDIFLIWYDPVQSSITVTNWGAGHTPYIVTDTYRRTGGSADSERLLFYVDNTTKQIVYRRQNDRYQTSYPLPAAPNDVVEILKVSKNIYGGLTVLYVYEDNGQLTTGSFTARFAEDAVAIGTDGDIVDSLEQKVLSGTVTLFSLKEGAVNVAGESSSMLSGISGAITFFELRPAQIFLNEQEDTSAVLANSGTVSLFELKSSLINVGPFESSSNILHSSGDITLFNLAFSRIDIESFEGESTSVVPISGDITTFNLG